ncbi:iron ABC transporter permease [Paenibacillus sambharensis]|uniref:Iron ABC transporter permease n=1 Tax=Paenibacillus sambharensis TaxID=1803190 RepID=A0A2W1LTD6_9BACL|nr:iron ABC transporter permease [Paenibacillus sambharensis]PZD95041.1 iron ABC transporter permease [Paenibacillus sambharensis]
MNGLQTTALVKHYRKDWTKKLSLLAALLAALIVTGLYSITIGAVGIEPGDVARVILHRLLWSDEPMSQQQQMNDYIIWQLRLPRVCLGILAGAALAGAGAVMQGILRNPLADPFTLGVSSGAAFGAASAIVLGTSVFGLKLVEHGQVAIVLNAFLFACMAMIAVYSIARLKGGISETLLLAGVAISYLFSAGVSAMKYFSNNEALRDLVMWLMGGLWGAKWSSVGILFPILIISLLVLFRYAWDLNALSSGEEVASTLGVNVSRMRMICLILVTLAAASTIAFTGIIGFVGMVAPHISRMVIGVDNRFLLPCSCLLGGFLLLLADTLARTVMAPTEIPVGIITSLIGAPFFIYILIKKKRTIWA